jgi:hypothetical protein
VPIKPPPEMPPEEIKRIEELTKWERFKWAKLRPLVGHEPFPPSINKLVCKLILEYCGLKDMEEGNDG